MAKLSEKQLDGWEQKEDESFMTYFDRQDKMLDELILKSKNSNIILNKVISFPIADGKAWYLVTNESPLELTHIPYGDCYQVNYIMIKGLDSDDVANMTFR